MWKNRKEGGERAGSLGYSGAGGGGEHPALCPWAVPRAQAPSSCSRWPSLAVWAGGRPGSSPLVGAEGPEGAKAGSLGSSLGMQWPEVIPCDRLLTVQFAGLLTITGAAAPAVCL